jgi:hypothetical protein
MTWAAPTFLSVLNPLSESSADMLVSGAGTLRG